MWTAVLATLNLLDGTDYDVWSVNTEAEYHEEGEVVQIALDLHQAMPNITSVPSAAEPAGTARSTGDQAA